MQISNFYQTSSVATKYYNVESLCVNGFAYAFFRNPIFKQNLLCANISNQSFVHRFSPIPCELCFKLWPELWPECAKIATEQCLLVAFVMQPGQQLHVYTNTRFARKFTVICKMFCFFFEVFQSEIYIKWMN